MKGRGKWILRFMSPTTGRRRDMGLGVYPEVGIADARVRALQARQEISGGQDPIEESGAARAARRAIAQAMTFEQAARKVHAEQEPGWANKKHAAQWLSTLREHVFPRIGSKKVAGLTPAEFAEVLRPIWLTTPETATRVKQRCHRVMKWCSELRLLPPLRRPIPPVERPKAVPKKYSPLVGDHADHPGERRLVTKTTAKRAKSVQLTLLEALQQSAQEIDATQVP